MKKLYVLTALLCGVLVYRAQAGGDHVNTPSGTSGSINADYGGVDLWETTPGGLAISTVALPANASSPFPGQYGYYSSTTTPNLKTHWNIYGAYFSTGNCGVGDFIEVTASTGGFVATKTTATTTMAIRFYNNVNGSTSTSNNNIAACAGFTALRWPIRMYGNVYMNVSNQAGYNSQGILYFREPD